MPDGFSNASELADKLAADNQAEKDAALKAEADKNKSAEDLQKEKEAADLAKKTDEDANAKKLADEKEAATAKASQEAEEKRLTDLAATSGKTVDQIKTEEAAAAKEKGTDKKEEPADPLTDLLKEFKFNSKEDLIKHLKKADEKQKSPEEIKRAEEVYRANMNAFAVENEIMSLEDIHKLEEVKKATDEDLVYKKFAEEAREEILDEFEEYDEPTEDEILAKINEAFEREYPTKSKNKNAVTRAENKIKREAELIRKPFESAYEKAKERYDDEVSVRNAYPEYQKTMKKMIDSSVPATVSFYKDKDGENEISIDVELKEEDRKEILEKVAKKFQNPETFVLHQKGKSQEIQDMIAEEVERLAWKKTEKEGKKKLAERFEGIGVGKGSKVGAENSFETNQAKKGAEEKGNEKLKGQEAINAAIESTRKKP